MLKMTVNIHGKFGNQINNLSRSGAVEAELELNENHLSDLDNLSDTLTRLVWVMGNSLDAEAQRFTNACESTKPLANPKQPLQGKQVRELVDHSKVKVEQRDLRPVTPGQLRYLTALAQRAELSLEETVRVLHNCGPEQLSHRQASELIHQMVEVTTAEVAA